MILVNRCRSSAVVDQDQGVLAGPRRTLPISMIDGQYLTRGRPLLTVIMDS
jgi:hypothetical protein